MLKKKAYTHTGVSFRGASIYKDDAGVYYIYHNNNLYRLDIEPNTFENVQYDNENPIKDFILTGGIGVLNPH